MPEDQKNAVRWYIDCGEDDFLIEGNSLVHLAIHKKGITHEFRMREGIHSWTYWRESLPEVLEFVSMAFSTSSEVNSRCLPCQHEHDPHHEPYHLIG